MEWPANTADLSLETLLSVYKLLCSSNRSGPLRASEPNYGVSKGSKGLRSKSSNFAEDGDISLL